jgi:hypothetical protein
MPTTRGRLMALASDVSIVIHETIVYTYRILRLWTLLFILSLGGLAGVLWLGPVISAAVTASSFLPSVVAFSLVLVLIEGFVHLGIPRIRLSILDILLRTTPGGFPVSFRARLMGREFVAIAQTLESIERGQIHYSDRERPADTERYGHWIESYSKYIKSLLDLGLIVHSDEVGGPMYRITERGMTFLREYEKIERDLLIKFERREKGDWRLRDDG